MFLKSPEDLSVKVVNQFSRMNLLQQFCPTTRSMILFKNFKYIFIQTPRSKSTSKKAYALGSEARELTRLGIQHDLFSKRTNLLYKNANISEGGTILDVGCGPGFTTLELATMVGKNGEVYAMDECLKSLSTLSKRAQSHGWRAKTFCRLEHDKHGDIILCGKNVTDIESWRMFQKNPVDAVFVRWLLTWLQHSDVIRMHDFMSFCVKPGGKVAILDYFNVATFNVTSPSLKNNQSPIHWKYLCNILIEEWNRVGDPNVASYVPQLLNERGFKVHEVEPLALIIRPTDELWEWPTTYFKTQAKRLVDSKVINDEHFIEKFEKEWNDISKNEVAWYCPPVMATVIGERL